MADTSASSTRATRRCERGSPTTNQSDVGFLVHQERNRRKTMSAVPAKALNEMFFEKVATSQGKDKIAEFGGTYIRDRLREVSFARKIVPPTNVQRTELQRSVNHDTLVK